MSGVLFPDFLGTLSKAAAFESNRAQTDYLNEDRAAKAEIAPLIPKALQGDKEALNQIGARHPDTFTKLMPMLQSIDANQRAKVKETSEWTTRAAMGVLSLPENERPAAYQAALADGQRLGYKIDMPPQYDRAVEGRLRQLVNQTRTFENYWKNQDEGVTLVPSGGGGGMAPPAAGGGVNPYNIGNVRPVGGGPNSGFQQPASLDDGIRLAVNNVKAYPAKFNGGQPMTLMQIGARWAPAGDGANDPGQWARNVASIGGLDPNKPLDFNDPATAAAFARGVHGAEHGANKVLPPQAYVQAITGGAQPPGLAQGDAAPRGDASGNPIQTSDGGAVPRESMKMIAPNLPPGTSLAKDRKTGRYIVQEGHFVVYDDATKNPVGLYPIPKIKEPGAAPSGYQFSPDGRSLQVIPGGPADKPQGTGPFAGNSVEAQALNMLISNGTLTQPQAAELAAGKTITNPADGSVMFMTPSGLFGQKPGQPPQPVGGVMPAPQGGAPAPAAAPSGMIPVTPPKPVQMTEGQSNAALYADRMREAEAVISANEKAGMNLGGKALEALPGGVGNFLQSDQYQLFEQARRNFINAVLRRESGAVIADTEFANAEKQYFPRPGDSEAVLKQKAANRRSAIDGISRAAGPSYKPEATQAAPAPAPTPQQPAKQGSADRGKVLFDARNAIAKGADPAKVRERLKAMGIEDEP